MFKESLKGVSRKFVRCFKGVSGVFQGRTKGDLREFQRSKRNLSRNSQFQEILNDVSRMI